MTHSIIRRFLPWSVLPASVVILGLATLQPVSLAQDGDAPGAAGQADTENGQQVLTRGPVHEAFGQPTVLNPKPGLAIAKKPPQPVEELPPDEKPEGDNVAWIGGYWSYDEEKTDFMWVSGFWRVLPPGRQWMPGYWNDNAGQYQWVSGYWANAEQPEQQVIAEAPLDSLEQGPVQETAPSQDHIWAPGCWVYRDTRYLWRPGYWVMNQPGWCWVPDCYNWTPGGYIYVAGYWDHSIRRRGVLFAPCYLDPVVIRRPGFVYRPSICLDIDVITPHFFCRPTYGHYYFGDYYATSYLSVGITPWFNFTYARGPRFYSPDFSYYECHYRRTNPRWGVEVRIGYERYRDNVNLRPARTFVNQQTVINNITINNNRTNINNNTNNLALAKPIRTYTANMSRDNNAPMKFEKINTTQARNFSKTAVETRNLTQERAKLERNLGAATKTGSTAGGNTAIRTVTLPKSPILSKMSSNNTVETGKTNVGGFGGNVPRTPPALPGGSTAASKVGGGRDVGSKTMSGTGAGSKTGGTSASGAGTGSKTGPITGGLGAGSKTGGTSTSGAGTGSKTSPITGGPGAGSKTMGSSTGTGSTGTAGAGTKVGGAAAPVTGSKTGETGSTNSKVGGGSSTGIPGTGNKGGSGTSGGSTGGKVGGSSGSSGSGSKVGGSSGNSGSGSKIGGGSSGGTTGGKLGGSSGSSGSSGKSGGNSSNSSKKDKDKP